MVVDALPNILWDEDKESYEEQIEKACTRCIHMKENGCIFAVDNKNPINKYGCCQYWCHVDASKVFPDAGDYNDEDWYDDHRGEVNYKQVLIDCPICNKRHYPLRGKYKNITEVIDSGWRWVGLDFREPYMIFKTVCPRTKKEYKFTMYTPQ